MAKKLKLKIIPLGGLNEIGKNITAFEIGGEILVVDCGMAFPEDGMYGVDCVIPDLNYLVTNKEKVKGVVITHGHEDHIGSIAYLLRSVNVPVYGTRLALGLIEQKLKEHGILSVAKLNRVSAGDSVKNRQKHQCRIYPCKPQHQRCRGYGNKDPLGNSCPYG